MIAADFLCRAEGAVPPLARASFRRGTAVAGRSHRKPRSRSSPVRIGTASPDGRARSPSVSPPRLSPERALARADAVPDPRSHAPHAALASLEHRHHFVKQRAGLPCSSAWFSPRPPVLPVRLVSAGASWPPATAPMGPTSQAVPPPPLPLHSEKKAFAVPTQGHKHKQPARGSSSKCRRMVRRLLAELLAALPLTAPLAAPLASPNTAPPATTTTATYSDTRADEPSISPMRVPRSSRTVVALAGPPALHAAANRSVAVQALATISSKNDDNLFYFDESQKEGWLGGVRALRDSHVRLVLRQLRHIERLNRALDRAARPPPAAAADAAYLDDAAGANTARPQQRTSPQL